MHGMERTQATSVRLPPDLLERIDRRAAVDRRSRNMTIMLLLDLALSTLDKYGR